MAEEMPLFMLASAVETRYKEQFADALENWRGIEAKAQGLIAIAGILLAGILAIAGRENFTADAGVLLALAASVTFLTLGLIDAVLVLRMRTMRSPPQASLLRDVILDVARTSHDATTDEIVSSFIRDQFDAWEGAVDDMQSHIRAKAAELRTSTYLILAALLSLVISTLSVILTG